MYFDITALIYQNIATMLKKQHTFLNYYTKDIFILTTFLKNNLSSLKNSLILEINKYIISLYFDTAL